MTPAAVAAGSFGPGATARGAAHRRVVEQARSALSSRAFPPLQRGLEVLSRGRPTREPRDLGRPASPLRPPVWTGGLRPQRHSAPRTPSRPLPWHGPGSAASKPRTAVLSPGGRGGVRSAPDGYWQPLPVSLQWARGLSAAEVPGLVQRLHKWPALQRGHGLPAVELPSEQPASTPAARASRMGVRRSASCGQGPSSLL